MEYSNVGRIVAVIVIGLCVIFLRSPRKSFFVYPLKRRQGKLFLAKSIVRAMALVVLVLRSFDLRGPDGYVPVRTPQRHIAFLLDGSLSMSASDVEPNRFQHAAGLIHQIASHASGADESLIVFSGIPVIRVPWTSDLSGFSDVLTHMSLGEFPATDSFLGTALGDALLLTLQQFDTLPSGGSRSIVIISDGDSNKGYGPQKVLSLLHDRAISVYFLAVGTDGYEVGKDATGLPVTTSFDTELMQQFADETNGKLFMNPAEPELGELIDALNAGGPTTTSYEPHYLFLNDYLAQRLVVLFSALFIFTCVDIVHMHKRR